MQQPARHKVKAETSSGFADGNAEPAASDFKSSMNVNPLTTIVIPTWNREQLVQEAVASVVAQTCRDWELFIVDDGSTDNTIRCLEDRFTLPDIHVVPSAHIGHVGKLRNLGARAGNGEFVAFLDSDDLWHPEKLEKQMRAIERSGTNWSYTEYGLFGDDGVELPLRSGTAPAISGHVLRALLEGDTGVCPCTLLVRRTLFEAVGGFSEDPRMAYRDDADIALRLARASDVTALPEKLVRVREHPGRSTASLSNPHEHSAAVFELFLESETDGELKKLARSRLAECLAEAGLERAEAGDYATAAALFWRALVRTGRVSSLIHAAGRRVRRRL